VGVIALVVEAVDDTTNVRDVDLIDGDISGFEGFDWEGVIARDVKTVDDTSGLEDVDFIVDDAPGLEDVDWISVMETGLDGFVCKPSVDGVLAGFVELVGVRMIIDVFVQLPTSPISVVLEVITPVQVDVSVVTYDETQVRVFQSDVDSMLVAGLKVEKSGTDVATKDLEALFDGVSTTILVTIPVTRPVPLFIDV